MKSLKHHPHKSFFSQHASVIFIVALIAIGCVFLPLGLFLKASENQIVCGTGVILLQVSGCLIAVALTAIFVNLPDLRNYLATVIATLFSAGEVVPILSKETKRTLIKRLHLDSVKGKAFDIEPSLFQHLEAVFAGSISTPYLTNFHCSLTLTRDTTDRELAVTHIVTSYKIHTYHLSPNAAVVPIRVFRETTFSKRLVHLQEQWIRDFSVKLGDQTFSQRDATFQTDDIGDSIRLRIFFELDVALTEDTDFSSVIETVDYNRDPVEMVFARYPCQGFHASLMFEEGYSYDCGWFMHCSPERDTPEIGYIDYLRNGISARTNMWLLPGEGVTLYYFKLPGGEQIP